MKTYEFIKLMFRDSERETKDADRYIYRAWRSTGRYVFDFAEEFTSTGWIQFDTDQDAEYFGKWVNPTTMQTLCYAEGDWTLVECMTVEAYNTEVRECIEFFEPAPAFVVIDDHSVTRHYQDQNEYFATSKQS